MGSAARKGGPGRTAQLQDTGSGFFSEPFFSALFPMRIQSSGFTSGLLKSTPCWKSKNTPVESKKAAKEKAGRAVIDLASAFGKTEKRCAVSVRLPLRAARLRSNHNHVEALRTVFFLLLRDAGHKYSTRSCFVPHEGKGVPSLGYGVACRVILPVAHRLH